MRSRIFLVPVMAVPESSWLKQDGDLVFEPV